jgi:sugar/nucleoside kinase (ribokinase family)
MTAAIVARLRARALKYATAFQEGNDEHGWSIARALDEEASATEALPSVEAMSTAAKIIRDAAERESRSNGHLGNYASDVLRSLLPAIEAATQTSKLESACAWLESRPGSAAFAVHSTGVDEIDGHVSAMDARGVERHRGPGAMREALISRARALGWTPPAHLPASDTKGDK